MPLKSYVPSQLLPDRRQGKAAAAAADPGTVRRERAGWLVVAGLTAVVAASWAPLLTTRFGNNHWGRVQGRYALQLRNLHELGLTGSEFGADWSPYTASPYAHHPPLPNLLAALFGLLPGEPEWQVRLGPYLLALLAIPAAAALLRGFAIRWGPTLLAVGLMVVTGFFWVYAPLMFDLGLILALSAAVAHLRRHPAPPGWLVVAGCGLAVLASLGSWPGIAFAAALGLWLFAARRLDRVTVAVGASMVLGAAVSLAYMVGIHGISGLSDQTELRTAGGGFTAIEFAARMEQWLSSLLPVWYLALFPFAIAAGLLDRRTRLYTAGSAALAAGWVLVLNNGAYVHDYWLFLVLVPGLAGTGALLDGLARRLPGRHAQATAGAAAVGLAVGFAVMVFGSTGQTYLHRPADAGRLVADNLPADSQQYAWHAGVAAPRWLAYYWDRPPRNIDVERLTEQAAPSDLVLVDLDRPPDWLPDPAAAQPVASQGRYALFRAEDLRAAVDVRDAGTTP
jgi:hypothetical protein